MIDLAGLACLAALSLSYTIRDEAEDDNNAGLFAALRTGCKVNLYLWNICFNSAQTIGMGKQFAVDVNKQASAFPVFFAGLVPDDGY